MEKDIAIAKRSFDKWLQTRPKIVQEVGNKYPAYLQWRIKAGAPYALTCPGSKVTIIAYKEDGGIIVALKAWDKLPATIKHEKALCEEHGTNYENVKDRGVSAHIDPAWLEALE